MDRYPTSIYWRWRRNLAAATLASFSAWPGDNFRTTGAAAFFGVAATGSAGAVIAANTDSPAGCTAVDLDSAANAGAASLMISDCSRAASLALGAGRAFEPAAADR